MIYFNIQLDQQEMSNLAAQIPEENFLLIKPSFAADDYYGVIEEGWYGHMIKNLPRQLLNSLEVITAGTFKAFMQSSEKNADERQFAGNTALLA